LFSRIARAIARTQPEPGPSPGPSPTEPASCPESPAAVPGGGTTRTTRTPSSSTTLPDGLIEQAVAQSGLVRPITDSALALSQVPPTLLGEPAPPPLLGSCCQLTRQQTRRDQVVRAHGRPAVAEPPTQPESASPAPLAGPTQLAADRRGHRLTCRSRSGAPLSGWSVLRGHR